MSDKIIQAPFVKLTPISELENIVDPLSGKILYYDDGGSLKTANISTFKSIIVSGIKGKATPTSSPTPWTSGNPDLFEKWEVNTAGTYTHFIQADTNPVIVSSGDLAANFVQIWVKNGVSEKILSAKLGVSAQTVFDETDNTNPSTMKATADYLFYEDADTNDNFSEATELTQINAGTSIYYVDENLIPANIFINKIEVDVRTAGVVNIEVINSAMNSTVESLKRTLAVGVQTIDLNKSYNQDVRFSITTYQGTGQISYQTGSQYPKKIYVAGTAYNGFLGIKVFYKKRKPATKEKIYYLEDYGAVKLNPNNPNAGIDCTAAFQSCLDDIANDETIKGGKIVLLGMYKISGTSKLKGGLWAQVHLPVINFNADNPETVNQKTISIVGVTPPIMEDQGIIEMPVSYGGCGFYSTLTNQIVSDRYNYILASPQGTLQGGSSNPYANIFGAWNYLNLYMDNITFMVNSKDSSGNPIQNTMGCVNLMYLSHFGHGAILCRTNVPGYKTVQPAEKTCGFAYPTQNNHATVYGDYLRCIGFGTGMIAGEHQQLGTYVGLLNTTAVECVRSYPITINTCCLESNKTPVKMGNKSVMLMGVFQTERTINTSKWYFQTSNDITCSTGTAKVVINMSIIHNEGGSEATLTFDSGITRKVIMNEQGNSEG
ncbi:hypothetical protein M2347_000632 [Chryseobacterium sp. H1D6B]|uniref:hypothetical protein n=1 Tax=Chryseobacterium sp. H1D6B TaxID=2940588 RepID=UPI0015CD72DD|nr:hypothetical protein [Chryseobacterium sp. H1D6B]MDH6250905.1 hypothetical protein [Chryseobacterium sp. H1D6B]